MSGDDAVPATIPKRARTAVKRPDPIETKNRMKGKMNNLNKRSPARGAQRGTSEKEKEVAEALFDLANLAGTDMENGEDTAQPSEQTKRSRGKKEEQEAKKSSKSKSKDGFANGAKGGFAMNKAGKMGKNEAMKQGVSMPPNPWQQGLPHPAFSQNLYSQMMAWQQANFPPTSIAQAAAAQPNPQQNVPAAPVKSLKRCANHVYIAHLIYYHQRMQQATLMQTMGMNLTAGGLPPGVPPESILQQQLQNQAQQQGGDGKAGQNDGNPQHMNLNNLGLQAGQLQGLKNEQDANALKAQLLMAPNPAILSLLGGGYPPGMAQQAGAKSSAEALAALGPQAAALGMNQAAGNLPQQMQQYASQLQNMTMMQQQGSFPMMMPPGQFPMPQLGQNAGGLTPQQMAAFYVAAQPSLALANAGALGANAWADPAAAAAAAAAA
eukprot:CAMPEP_0182608814 /NCGR_PEP_ID=MMETSP1330-20130603/3120_1 /TAXON_ID=464278 /ORGANISM="Picochlorum sp., Strain RCC944" /LENGTH=435 /DNA_ID=CAMNT_0024827619 /DNA_START=585 /DNA_END=1888 /DNA_ORIENTATION=-